MAETIYVGDYGWLIKHRALDEDGNVVDISGYTTSMQFFIKSPSGTVAAKSGSFSTDGTDGYLEYAVDNGLIDAAGSWYAQMRLQSGTEELSGTPVRYYAETRFEAS